MRSFYFALVVAAFCGPVVLAADATPEQLEFFEKKVRPILVTRCQECHGADLAESKLRVDSLRGLLVGGERGPAIVVGKGKESLLIRAINHGETLQMPPKQKLPPGQIADLTEWINRGAAWPNESPADVAAIAAGSRMVFSEKQKQHWAFQPIADPPLPAAQNASWPKSTLDLFTLARLEAAGLQPTKPAEKHALIRRVTFDLTGLPPSPDQVAAFIADEAPDAYDRLLDRLLASPAHGEKYARHWLDLARYADSNGLDENVAYANAYRYRDYVIGAFNGDKPYDRFVQEQIAGDLLPSEDEAASFEALTATAFLSLGAKMLAEDDPVKMQMDIIDEQLDTLGKCFLGLTLGCARCHDHKFDPIDSHDYYGLAGILKSTKTMENHNVVAMWNERPVAPKAWLAERETRVQKVAADRKAADALAAKGVDEILQTERRRAGDYLWAAHVRNLREDALAKQAWGEKPAAERSAVAGLRNVEAENYDRGNVTKDTTTHGAGIGVLVNRGEKPNFVEYDFEVATAGAYQLELRYAALDSRPINVQINGKVVLEKAAAKTTGGWAPVNQKWFVEGIVTLPAGKVTLRFEQPEFFPHLDQWLLAPAAELPTEAATAPASDLREPFVVAWQAALRKSREVADSPLAPWLSLLAGDSPRDAVVRFSEATTKDEPLRKFLHDDKGPFAKPKDAESLLAAETREQLKKARDAAAAEEKAIPAIPKTMAVSEGKPENLRIHFRGNHLTLGEEAPRQFLRVVAGESQTPIAADRSGRLDLARWMTSTEQPLTSRVIVNRVWQWHFGAGLVRSGDNFGLLGESPSHPELLDHLARRFVEDGWSLKRLHRRIMTSATYLQATGVPAATDLENQLLAVFPRRRLQAEEIRDALLQISDSLDLRMGGSHLPTGNHQYVNAGATEMYRHPRRSIYLPLIRSALYDVFQAFDFADPSVLVPRRETTTVAPQALFMLNSKLTADGSQSLAAELIAQDTDGVARVQLLFTKCYSRAATETEVRRALDFITHYTAAATERKIADPERKAWQALCRSVFSANEFVYVE